MKLALAQINTTVGDISGNLDKILQFAARAAAEGAQLVVFPELAITGYPPMDLLLKSNFVQANLDALDILKREIRGIAAVVGYVDLNPSSGRPLRNAAAFIADGSVQAVQFKTLLPNYDVFDEDRYFEPATSYTVPQCNGFKVGLSICEDIWVSEQLFPKSRYLVDPIEKVAAHRPDILVNISASPFSIGKGHLRYELIRDQALRHKIPVVYVNQVGGNDQLIFDGRTIACDAQGNLVACAVAFAEDLVIVELERERDGSVSLKGTLTAPPINQIADVHDALVLGTRDYMRKCGFTKAVIGLSGGIDSAVTCAIACAAIGAGNVLGVAMPSPYSSGHSVTDAEDLAKSLGVEYSLIPIGEAMNAFDAMLAQQFSGLSSDVTEENIQARSRGLILMSISNKMGHLVLTTGNKSELAVGYCTLYGDMCGGLAVISDVPKTMVYELAEYINLKAGKDLIPRSTIEKPPSAELRVGQLDQDSLPPYEVLDAIIHEYVEQRKGLQEIIDQGFKPEIVTDVINKIDRNEYKRKQAAPGLKVTALAFGVGRRMPIAQKFRETRNMARA
jgi:NAD+ synthase (glutamine-hydrolysing)